MYTIEKENGIFTIMHPVKTAGISLHSAIIQGSNLYNSMKVHVNCRHSPLSQLPKTFKKHPVFLPLRDPIHWYKSFYAFFVNVEGYLSWTMNDPNPDGTISPITPNEFVRRMINLRKTLIYFPNKARVFRNLLRSQSNLHFITSYFKSDFHPNDEQSMEQFNMSLYDWFHRPLFDKNTIPIPMDRLDIFEEIIGVEIPHENKTDHVKKDFQFSDEVIELIKSTHGYWYNILDNFDDSVINYQGYPNTPISEYTKGKI